MQTVDVSTRQENSSSSESAPLKLKASFDQLAKAATQYGGDPSKLLAELKKAFSLLTTHSSSPSLPPKLAQLGPLFASTLLSLLVALPNEGLAFLAALVEHLQKQVTKLWSGERGSGSGKEELGVALEGVLESVLRGMKLFLRDDEGKGRVVSREDKLLLGSTCFASLSKVLSEFKFRIMLHRRVLDVFDYSINHCSENKRVLAQAAVLGPQALGSLIFKSADFGLTERALELAFRIGEAVGVEAKDNGVSKGRWDSHLFRAAQYGAKDVKSVLAKFRGLTLANFEAKSPAFLRMLSTRDPLNFQPIFALSLAAGGELLENEDGEEGEGITYGVDVSFNRSTFTAVTTKAVEEGSDDVVELLLEVEYSMVERVEIDDVGDTPIVRMSLLTPPTLDSEPLESKKGALEIAFRVRSTDTARLRTILASRNLSQSSSPTDLEPKKSTLPTPKGTPRSRAKPQPLRHPSPLLLEPLFDPKPSSRPTDRLVKATKLAPKDVNALSLPKAPATKKPTSRPVIEPASKESGKRAESPLALHSASKRVKIATSAGKAKTVLFANDVLNPLPTKSTASNVRSTASHVLVPNSDPFENDEQVLTLDDSEDSDEEESQALQSQLSGMSRKEVLKMLAKANEEDEENSDASREEVAMVLDEVVEVVVEEDVEMGIGEAFEEELAAPVATESKFPRRRFLTKPTHISPQASQQHKSPRKKHKSRKVAPVRESPPPVDAEEDFSRLLMELSEVVLKKFASRREDAAHSFDAGRVVLDAAVLKLSEQFYLETEEIIENLKEVLNFGAAQTKLLDSVKRLVSHSQKAVKVYS